MKHVAFWLFWLPFGLLVMLPLYAIGACAAVVWSLLEVGWWLGIESAKRLMDAYPTGLYQDKKP